MPTGPIFNNVVEFVEISGICEDESMCGLLIFFSQLGQVKYSSSFDPLYCLPLWWEISAQRGVQSLLAPTTISQLIHEPSPLSAASHSALCPQLGKPPDQLAYHSTHYHNKSVSLSLDFKPSASFK
jgi:hypothetical protein